MLGADDHDPGFSISPTFLSRDELKRMGFTRHRLERAVAERRIIRVRKGRYVHGNLDPDLVTVAKLGGRLDCVSLVRRLGVFVWDASLPLHIQVDVGASRLPPRPSAVVCHWRTSRAREFELVADVVEALAQAVRCQGPREAIAMLDSALHNRLIDQRALGLVFARLPRRFTALRGLLDARSESGAESLMRLILRTLGCDVDLQVKISGVGRVDFILDGWLIVECDSETHHSGWGAQKRDRRRDLAAARVGYTTVRVIAEDIFFHRDEVREALTDVLAHGPRRQTRRQNSSVPGAAR
ncbi:endonuclease domain-containing protein [Microbacterium sp. NPDC058389]|uniref:endonuclease domain-containing protein n=1 Tax=Microbacterium sp. NPDC058389 TaxID=3346475 RepID=UPI003647B251